MRRELERLFLGRRKLGSVARNCAQNVDEWLMKWRDMSRGEAWREGYDSVFKLELG